MDNGQNTNKECSLSQKNEFLSSDNEKNCNNEKCDDNQQQFHQNLRPHSESSVDEMNSQIDKELIKSLSQENENNESSSQENENNEINSQKDKESTQSFTKENENNENERFEPVDTELPSTDIEMTSPKDDKKVGTTSSKDDEQVETKFNDDEEKANTEFDSTLAQLVSMGFEFSLAQLAIEENKNLGFDATLQWLLQQQKRSLNKEDKFIEETPSYPKRKLAPYRRPISAADVQPPKKGILKPSSQPDTRPIWKRDWLSSLNTRLQNVANTSSSSPTSASSTTSFFSNALKRFNTQITSYSSQQEEHPEQQQLQSSSSSTSSITNDRLHPADQISQSHGQQQYPPSSPNGSLLTQKSLKRVRFSVEKLTDEYPHSPIPGDSDNSDWDDEYDFHEWDEKQNRKTQTQPKVEQKVYSAEEVVQYYLAACSNREDFPLDRLTFIFKKACRPGGSLQIIDLTGDIIDRRIAEPMADVFTLEFGLQKLVLERCEIEDDTLKILIHSLLVNDTVSHLNLSNNKRIRSNGFNYIAIYIKKSKSLKYLDLSGINIDKKSATFLAQAFISGMNKSGAILETLKLDNCGLKNNVLETLGPGIRRSNLRYLSLRYNRINHVGAAWIGVMLRDYDDSNWEPNNPSFSQALPAYDEFEEELAEKSRRRKRGLESLDITGNDLRSGIQYVAQVLRRNRSLKELFMPDNQIDPKGLVYMADGLRHNQCLELLDLSRNPAGGPSTEGITALRNALTFNTTLKILFLSKIQLDTEGAIVIAEYLPETKSLIHLDLTFNPEIDIAGVMALAVSIKMNESIRILDLNIQNDAESARLSRDILRACVRNTELVQKQKKKDANNNFLFSEFQTKSRSMLSDDRESKEISLNCYLEDLKKDMKLANECLNVFEEMLSSEIPKSNKIRIETNEVIEQINAQCQKFQSKIQSYISSIVDEKLLGELLTLNDKLSSALHKYEKIYKSNISSSNSEETNSTTLSEKNTLPEQNILSEQNTLQNTSSQNVSNTIHDDHGHDNNNTNNPSPKLPIIATKSSEPEFSSPTFSIGDSDDDDNFENIGLLEGGKNPMKHSKPTQLHIESLHAFNPNNNNNNEISRGPKSPMEEMVKMLEVEEGEILKLSKEALDGTNSEEFNKDEKLCGEELKIQLFEEKKII